MMVLQLWLVRLHFVVLTLQSSCSFAFVTTDLSHQRARRFSLSPTLAAASPRTGFLQQALDVALASPLYRHVLVPQARQKMVDTAASNGIPWMECLKWIRNASDEWTLDDDDSAALMSSDSTSSTTPEYYQQPFHAYFPDGNLCWQAAWEAEIASAAVGARNFPAHGRNGEQAFRDSFRRTLSDLGASVPQDAFIVDLGCGTGLSTRPLAESYPQAKKILGLDLSPYFIAVGRKLLKLSPDSLESNGPWINSITFDDRIEYRVAAAEETGLPSNSVDVVNLLFVAHELPSKVTLSIIQEAHRILKPNGGQLWFSEMDFEAPAYAAQRSNPLLFSLIRSTEPYLDDYADHSAEFRAELKRLFVNTKMNAATGRHFASVAVKGSSSSSRSGSSDGEDVDHVFEDLRFTKDGDYRVEDTHLMLWEDKSIEEDSEVSVSTKR